MADPTPPTPPPTPLTAPPDFYFQDIANSPMPKKITKAEYFRDPKNFFGINVTTVEKELGPHWHPNADEFDYFLEGTATVTIVEPAGKKGGKTNVFQVSPGDVIVIPQGYAHSYVVKPGNPPLKFLAVFNNSAFQVIDSHQVPDSTHG